MNQLVKKSIALLGIAMLLGIPLTSNSNPVRPCGFPEFVYIADDECNDIYYTCDSHNVPTVHHCQALLAYCEVDEVCEWTGSDCFKNKTLLFCYN
ncbi:hypothetical protein SAMN06265350_1122 [Solitalea koreensis]|uniref:Chitin binding Peritrophin-A domain-containing protein n=1 Tax=Solitalea koreensis TaxID=543615 RepID=A0A521E6J4_9SPHI|nr:hypothetical protein SAMN06265350_1122 [Solitalea koreensis]